ncbi:M18 family aminopeptidase [Lachnotalea glycerini]|uniref:M18 family aminopeptidase n=1 Tax=Lachnotalea glycerini TaxID=1763509 RepID=A0A371JDM1_9FIRM|nr:M18 family aminopeptidase [Lachnotalea glycerini]RDY30861.1 M18 family aminopeptidase [Lachnotalea glycerini]
MSNCNKENLFKMLSSGTSPYMVVKESVEQLEEAGFKRLELKHDWGLDHGGKYYVEHHGSSLFAFAVGRDFAFRENFKIVTAHTDFPGFRIKPNPDLVTNKYCQINVEVYGGPILNTWLDRPLSAAGRVTLKSDDVFHPKIRIIDLKKPLFIIPNLAIHLNRDINKGIELNKQIDLLPITAIVNEELGGERFIKYLAKELNTSPEAILDYELNLYNLDEPCLLGMEEEFLSSPRIDNLTSVQAALTGMIQSKAITGINVAALFDHEEVGSRTKQGAGSSILALLLEKIFLSFGRDRAKFLSAVSDSCMLSVDVAHGLHPNKMGRHDITNQPVLGQGVCIKESCSQSYATDSEAIAIVEQLCLANHIAYQKFANRSDIAGGSTIGAIASTHLPMRIVDIGIPILAMHSSREVMGIKDQDNLIKILQVYFS